MARIRSVKPELPQDAKLARVSRDARLLFIYLWTVADDHGYFRAEPRKLAGDTFPFDPDADADHVQGWLDELLGIGVVAMLHDNDGMPVGLLRGWTKHQKIANPAKSFLRSTVVGDDLPYGSPARRQIWERDGGQCRYCGVALLNPPWSGAWLTHPDLSVHPKLASAADQQRFAEIDHAVPLEQGGDNSMTNLVLACRPCNRAKGPRTLEQWQTTTSYENILQRRIKARGESLSLESRVLSPDLPFPNGNGDEPRSESSLGAFYGQQLKPLCYPSGAPEGGRKAESRDVSVLRDLVLSYRREEILLAAQEARRVLGTEPFSLALLRSKDDAGRWRMDQFKDAAYKRESL